MRMGKVEVNSCKSAESLDGRFKIILLLGYLKWNSNNNYNKNLNGFCNNGIFKQHDYKNVFLVKFDIIMLKRVLFRN